jgi:hypothetical protein
MPRKGAVSGSGRHFPVGLIAEATSITPVLTRSSSGRCLGRHACSRTISQLWEGRPDGGLEALEIVPLHQRGPRSPTTAASSGSRRSNGPCRLSGPARDPGRRTRTRTPLPERGPRGGASARRGWNERTPPSSDRVSATTEVPRRHRKEGDVRGRSELFRAGCLGSL